MGDPLASVRGFLWDGGNEHKSTTKHRILPAAAEEVFLNHPQVVDTYSKNEPRWIAYGKTFDGKALAVVFTVRKNMVRLISARPMSRKEGKRYA